VLQNRWVRVRPGLVLAGVDDLTRHSRSGVPGDPLAKALAGLPSGSAVILLSHSPLQAERAAVAGAGLMLCGHTHGGQIWPFNYLVGLRYPMIAGRYAVGGTTVIVTRGAGTWGPRMRLWLPGEILRITLRSPRE
jgi:predicted MPP superfamily phosphohydrolase